MTIDVPVQPSADLYMIRHGQTDWNLEGRFQGRSDISLNATGLEQADKAGEQLAGLLKERELSSDDLMVLCSPMKRARQSAKEICQKLPGNPEPKIEPVLTELSFGDWEGMTTLEVKAAFPEDRRERKKDRWGFAPPGGESFASRAPDIGNLLADIDRPTILVCHAGVIKICLYLLGAIDLQSSLTYPVSQDRIYMWSDRRLAAH